VSAENRPRRVRSRKWRLKTLDAMLLAFERGQQPVQIAAQLPSTNAIPGPEAAVPEAVASGGPSLSVLHSVPAEAVAVAVKENEEEKKKQPPFATWRDLRSIVLVSQSTWARMVKNGTAPAPVVLSPGKIAWRRSAVEAWVESRRARSGK
jgi:predicted DNA-binding transcriptional regulator AlpA